MRAEVNNHTRRSSSRHVRRGEGGHLYRCDDTALRRSEDEYSGRTVEREVRTYTASIGRASASGSGARLRLTAEDVDHRSWQ